VRLNLPSLELRRLYLDLILCYKIVFGLVCVNFDDFFTFSPSFKREGIHTNYINLDVQIQFVKTFLLKESLMSGTVYQLPPTVSFSSLSSFKRSLKNTDFTPYMKCSV